MLTRSSGENAGNEYEVVHSAGLLVLIIDGNAGDREACVLALSRSAGTRYRFVTASDGASGLQAIATHAPDLVLLEYLLPGGDGLDVLTRISEQYPLLPVIMLTAQGNEAVAARGIKAGAADYFNKSDLLEKSPREAAEANPLSEAIQTAMSERKSRRRHAHALTQIQVLIIDDNPDDRAACIRALRRQSGVHYLVAEAVDGAGGLEALTSQPPDILLLDYSLPGDDGLDLLRHIRETRPFLPVIILTGHGSEAVAVLCIKAGAADYISKSTLSGSVLHRSIVAAIEHNRDARTIDQQSRTIQRQRENLEDSNHFLHNLLDHIPDPIFVKNGRTAG